MLAPAFDNQHAVLAPGVFGAIPLQFPVAHEAGFVGPTGGVWAAVFFELVGPYKLPAVGGLRTGEGRQEQRDEDQAPRLANTSR